MGSTSIHLLILHGEHGMATNGRAFPFNRSLQRSILILLINKQYGTCVYGEVFPQVTLVKVVTFCKDVVRCHLMVNCTFTSYLTLPNLSKMMSSLRRYILCYGHRSSEKSIR